MGGEGGSPMRTNVHDPISKSMSKELLLTPVKALTPLSKCLLLQQETDVLYDQLISPLPQEPQPGTTTSPVLRRGQSARPSSSNVPSRQLETQGPHKSTHGFCLWHT